MKAKNTKRLSQKKPSEEITPWQPFHTAPKNGRRIELKRDGCFHSDRFPVTGCYNGGTLVLSALFIDPMTKMMFDTPTHWREATR